MRSFNFFGLGSKFNIMQPYALGNWEGIYQNIDTTTTRSGLADLRMGFSINFKGSPALSLEKFKAYKQTTIAGFSMQMVAPTGAYDSDRLINIGSNRWAFRPQLGMSHRIDDWYIEMAISAWFFTINNNYWKGNTLEQRPVGVIKTHLIKTFAKDIWAAIGIGYAYGGRTFTNEIRRDASISTARLGGIVSIPIKQNHSIKIKAVKAIRFKEGANYFACNVTYQLIWNDNPTKK